MRLFGKSTVDFHFSGFKICESYTKRLNIFPILSHKHKKSAFWSYNKGNKTGKRKVNFKEAFYHVPDKSHFVWLQQSPFCPRTSVHLNKNMKTVICNHVKVGSKTEYPPIRTGCVQETLETLMCKSESEQFYDLCASYKELHVNNVLPELCSKRRSKVLWGPTQAAVISRPSAESSASVSYSTSNQQVEAGHR